MPYAPKGKSQTLPAIPDKELPDYMRALSEKERTFVQLLFMGTSRADAARAAGYGNKEGTTSNLSFAQIGHRILGYPRVQEAIMHETKKLIRAQGPDAIQALQEILGDKGSRDRLKAVGMVLNRLDPEIQRVDASVTVKFDPVKTSLEYFAHLKEIGASKDVLVAEFGEHGVDRLEAMLSRQASNSLSEDKEKIVDADFKEIPADPDADLGL